MQTTTLLKNCRNYLKRFKFLRVIINMKLQSDFLKCVLINTNKEPSDFLGGATTPICHFFCPSICPSVCHAPYFRNHTSCDHNLWCTCVKRYPRCFFIFSKFLIFWVVRVVKWQKMVQNDKKFCLSHSISQEPYII